MSSANILTANEVFIGPWDAASPGTAPPSDEDRLYILSIDPEQPYLRVYCSERPDLPDPKNDEPLRLQVIKNCRIILELDNSWNWTFRHPAGDPKSVAITMNVATNRYFNLDHEVLNGKCRRVTFYSQFNKGLPGGAPKNFDPFNIYILLDQTMANGDVTTALQIKVDPDIQNPGNPPGLGGG